MKFCKDCEHHRLFGIIDRLCFAKVIIRTDLVTGEEVTLNRKSCYDQRGSTNNADCGPEAKFFSKNETL